MNTFEEIRQDILKAEDPKAAAENYIKLMKQMVNDGNNLPQEAWNLAIELISTFEIAY